MKDLAASKANMIVLETYRGNRVSILHRCNNCYVEYKCTPDGRLAGKGCKFCNGKLLKTHKQYVKDLAASGCNMIALEQYKGDRVKILHRCNNCYAEYKCNPNNKLQGYKCKMCSKTGLDIYKPALTYLVYFYTIDLYKPGCTGYTIKERYYMEKLPYEILFQIEFKTGAEALMLEQEWLNNTKHLQINTGLLHSGNTETFRV